MKRRQDISDKFQLRFIAALIIPVLLILWAKFSEKNVTIPVPHVLWTGYFAVAAGVASTFLGILSQLRSIKGAHVNSIPSGKRFKHSIYSITRYPVYSGVILICFGLSAIMGSASGFWLVSPMVTLLILVFVTTSETRLSASEYDFHKKPFLALPDKSDRLPSLTEKISSCLLVFVPWLIIYKAFIFIGAPDNAISTNLPFEKELPVWEFSIVFYSFAFLFSMMIPLVIKKCRLLRDFILDVWFTIIFVGIIYLAFPLIVCQKTIVPHSFFGHLILYERSLDGQSGALPSCHVIWAFLAARYFSISLPRFTWFWFTNAILISLSCITVAAHSLLDVVAGILAYLIIIQRQEIWNYLIKKAVSCSDQMMGWRIGSVSLRYQDLTGGVAVFTFVFLAESFLDCQHGFDLFRLSGSLAMAAPWSLVIVRFGRLYNISNSYVVNDFVRVQLCSIVSNIITGLILIRLLNSEVSSTFIAGIFLILVAALFYFEQSSLNVSGTGGSKSLTLEHSITIALLLTGIMFTAIPNGPGIAFHPKLLPLFMAIIAGIFGTYGFSIVNWSSR